MLSQNFTVLTSCSLRQRTEVLKRNSHAAALSMTLALLLLYGLPPSCKRYAPINLQEPVMSDKHIQSILLIVTCQAQMDLKQQNKTFNFDVLRTEQPQIAQTVAREAVQHFASGVVHVHGC